MNYTKLTNLEIQNLKVNGANEGNANRTIVESKSISANSTIKYGSGKFYDITATAASKVLTISDIPNGTAFLLRNAGATNSFTLKHSSDTGVTIAASSLYLVIYTDEDSELVIEKIN